MLVEDDASLREALCASLVDAGYETIPCADGDAALAALAALRDRAPDLLLTDVHLGHVDGDEVLKSVRRSHPFLPVMLMTGDRDVERAAAAMRAGATDYLAKPFDEEVLLERIGRCIRPAEGPAPVAEDPVTRRVVSVAERVAATDATVMITGASGTGKEVLARFLHARSRRCEGPFVAINCAAIPENMLEAELFGYERGAFTGAQRSHAGKFEQAQRGTLLLDEITEMDLGLQAKLLRVLQEREVERIGGRGPLALDVRVLATSNRDLRRAEREGAFREDLYYRLNVFPLRLPPLAERKGDVLPLARSLLARHVQGVRPIPEISDAAARALLAHDWPGNVRELDNLLQRALILAVGDVLEIDDLVFGDEDEESSVAAGEGSASRDDAARLDQEMKIRERDLIREALARSNGSRKDAAAQLGIPARTLRYKIARLREVGLDPLAAPERELIQSGGSC
jgi:two-component system response regulator FlrC